LAQAFLAQAYARKLRRLKPTNGSFSHY